MEMVIEALEASGEAIAVDRGALRRARGVIEPSLGHPLRA
jgi:hypothetical protein